MGEIHWVGKLAEPEHADLREQVRWVLHEAALMPGDTRRVTVADVFDIHARVAICDRRGFTAFLDLPYERPGLVVSGYLTRDSDFPIVREPYREDCRLVAILVEVYHAAGNACHDGRFSSASS